MLDFYTSYTMEKMLVFLVVANLVVSGVVQGQSSCPLDCDCQRGDGGTIVHCKYQQRNGFPTRSEFPVDTIEVDYEYNNITMLSSLPSLPNLQRLYLDNCAIREISAYAFANVPSLKNITLKNNKIEKIDHQAFSGLTNLLGLYMEENKLQTLPDEVFSSLDLVDLYLDGSDIHSLTNGTFIGLSVQHLYMKRNNISRLVAGHLQPLKSSLVSFHLDENKQDLTVDPDTFTGFNNMEVLSFRNSKIRDVAFLGSANVKSLYLSGNVFPELDLSPYSNLASVETLELSAMGFRYFPAENALKHMGFLRKLDLSKNTLVRLDEDWFSRTPRLTELNLRGNKIWGLPAGLSVNLQQLTHLDLSMNEISFISAESFERMTKLSELDLVRNQIRVFSESLRPLFTRVRKVHTQDNPLHCNCEMWWYREWLDDLPQGMVETSCKTPENTYIYNLDRDQFKCKAPVITFIESQVYIPPGNDHFLQCNAEGDPAPVIKWMDRYNESTIVSPPEDRSRQWNSNAWELNDVTKEYSGTYVCTASNLVATVTRTTEVFVTNERPTTSSTTRPTTPVVTTPETTITTVPLTSSAKPISGKNKSSTSISDTTTEEARTVESKSFILDQKTLAIIIGSVGGFLILCVVLFLLVHIIRHTRHKRRYEVNDKAIIYHHDTNELDMSKDSKQIDV